MTLEAPAWAYALLREARVARLATADDAGQPLVVPVCYVFDGTACYTPIDSKPKRTSRLRRITNIEKNPQVSLLVDHYEEDWEALRHVIVQGRGEILHTGSDHSRAIDLLLVKYLQYQAMELDQDSGAIIKIVPQRFHAWRYSEK